MNKILFLTAYSSHSPYVFRYTLRLAQYFSSTITLCHIYPYDQESDLAQKEKEELQKLKTFAAARTPKQFHSIELTYVVRTGEVVEEVLALEEKKQFDLIVMGARAKNTLRNAFFGSISLELIDFVSSPIFFIPPIAEYIGISNITYATNLKSDDVKPIRYLLKWAEAFRAKLHLLHIYQWKDELPEAEQKIAKLLEDHSAHKERLIPKLIKGKPLKAIREYADFSQANLVATTTHKKGVWAHLFQTSITKEVLEKTKVPVLVLK